MRKEETKAFRIKDLPWEVLLCEDNRPKWGLCGIPGNEPVLYRVKPGRKLRGYITRKLKHRVMGFNKDHGTNLVAETVENGILVFDLRRGKK